VEILQPLAVTHIRLAARHILYMASIY